MSQGADQEWEPDAELNALTGALRSVLNHAQGLRKGERSERERRLAILCTKIEDAMAWSAYTATDA